MAGPTTDYGYTSFGSDVTTPGYVTESVASTASCTPTEPALHVHARRSGQGQRNLRHRN